MDLGSAILTLLVTFVIKGAVMVVGAWLLWRLYLSIWGKGGRSWIHVDNLARGEMQVVWVGLVLFYLAEVTCGLELITFHLGLPPFMDIMHSAFSGIGMSVFALGFYLLIDKKLILFGDQRCSMNRVCSGCPVPNGEPCKFHYLMVLMALAVVLGAMLCFAFPTDAVRVDTARVALPFQPLNDWFDNAVVPFLQTHVEDYEPGGAKYFICETVMVVEFRLLPLAAMVLGIVSLGALWKGREKKGIKFIVLGMGMLGYALFECVMYQGTNDALLGSIGHETGELWFLLALATFLRRAFPRRDGEPAEMEAC